MCTCGYSKVRTRGSGCNYGRFCLAQGTAKKVTVMLSLALVESAKLLNAKVKEADTHRLGRFRSAAAAQKMLGQIADI